MLRKAFVSSDMMEWMPTSFFLCNDINSDPFVCMVVGHYNYASSFIVNPNLLALVAQPFPITPLPKSDACNTMPKCQCPNHTIENIASVSWTHPNSPSVKVTHLKGTLQ